MTVPASIVSNIAQWEPCRPGAVAGGEKSLTALALLLLEFAVLDRRNPLLAHLNIFREK